MSAPCLAATTYLGGPHGRRVIELVADGVGNEGIARTLGVSLHQVKWALRQACAALGAKDRAHLVSIAYQRRILTVQ